MKKFPPTLVQNKPIPIMRSSTRLFCIIFMLVGALFSWVMMVFYQSEIKIQLSNLKIQENFAVELQSQIIRDVLNSIVGDLFFLSQQNELHEFLENKNPTALDKIASEYLSIVKQKQIYDQIRFIDSKGLETVRVNFNKGTPVRVANDKLQSKQKRYYFKDTYELEKADVFISPFDLNIENGVVEQPLKPMVRIGTPIFDSKNQKQGIVIINYLGNNLLNKLLASESVSRGQTMLLNADGYWLLSPTPDQAWGFMFEDEQRSFNFLYKKVWQEILLKESGQIKNADGLFTFKTIYPLKKGYHSSTGSGNAFSKSDAKIDHNIYQWHLVSFAPSHSITTYSNLLKTKLFAFGALVFLVVAGGSWIIALTVTKRKIYQSQLRLMALFDPLTELPNRRLFFDRLNMTLEHSRRNKNMFGMLYIDLDGFKSVNDTLGHEAGDELLCTVATRLNKILRKSDTIARIGGDEFAIIIGQLESATGAEKIAKKVISSLATPIQLKAGSTHVGASIGVSLYPADSTNAEELVQLADKSMYISKSKGKNTYTFCCTETCN